MSWLIYLGAVIRTAKAKKPLIGDDFLPSVRPPRVMIIDLKGRGIFLLTEIFLPTQVKVTLVHTNRSQLIEITHN